MVNLTQFDPYSKAIKHYMFDIMPEKYTTQTDDIIDRVVHALVTKRDAECFIRLLGDIYQAGWDKALKNVGETLEQNGLKLKITPPK